MTPLSEIEITLRDIEVALAIGVTAAERATPQMLRISVRVLTEAPRAGPFRDNGDLEGTLDYDRLLAFLEQELPASGPFHLLEAVGDRIACACLAASAQVREAEATLAKPSVRAGRSGEVSVSVRRRRSELP